MWNAITGIIAEIKRCEAASATIAAVAMAYVCIDTMAFLSMPANKSTQNRDDFVTWVDTYLKGHASQRYRYAGVDVYAARCSLLHTFGAEAEMHRHNPAIKMFGYHNGGQHAFDPQVSPNLVIIGIASFLNDVAIAVENFMKACQTESKLRSRVEARLPKVNQRMLFPGASGGKISQGI